MFRILNERRDIILDKLKELNIDDKFIIEFVKGPQSNAKLGFNDKKSSYKFYDLRERGNMLFSSFVSTYSVNNVKGKFFIDFNLEAELISRKTEQFDFDRIPDLYNSTLDILKSSAKDSFNLILDNIYVDKVTNGNDKLYFSKTITIDELTSIINFTEFKNEITIEEGFLFWMNFLNNNL